MIASLAGGNIKQQDTYVVSPPAAACSTAHAAPAWIAGGARWAGRGRARQHVVPLPTHTRGCHRRHGCCERSRRLQLRSPHTTQPREAAGSAMGYRPSAACRPATSQHAETAAAGGHPPATHLRAQWPARGTVRATPPATPPGPGLTAVQQAGVARRGAGRAAARSWVRE
eukprot:COSAG01_NODE_17241_length_1167_cov_1.585206_3_plen_170_part_00